MTAWDPTTTPIDTVDFVRASLQHGFRIKRGAGKGRHVRTGIMFPTWRVHYRQRYSRLRPRKR